MTDWLCLSFTKNVYDVLFDAVYVYVSSWWSSSSLCLYINTLCVPFPCRFVHAHIILRSILAFSQFQYYYFVCPFFVLRLHSAHFFFAWHERKITDTMRIVCGDGGGGNAASMLPLSVQNICTNQILFESSFFCSHFWNLLLCRASSRQSKNKIQQKSETIKKWSAMILRVFKIF